MNIAGHATSEYMEPLRSELGRWREDGATARLWWRDDDAANDTPQLRAMLEVARDCGLQVALAVVPAQATAALADLLRGRPCRIWQHGWQHEWHTCGEFGEGRSMEALIDDALKGQRALDVLFGPAGWQRVFVPPHHALSANFKSLLPLLGYVGVSLGELGDGFRPTPRIATLSEINTDVDIVDWSDARFIGPEKLVAKLLDALMRRRLGFVPRDRPIGLLTHHLIHTNQTWASFTPLLRFMRAHQACRFVAPEDLFAEKRPSDEDNARPWWARAVEGSPLLAGEVTGVVTSCGRYDLLTRTLDSFFQYNSHPLRRLIVIEDGPAPPPAGLRERYHHHPIIWSDTVERVGQVRALDMACRLIDTEYYFHFEDDWEFFRAGFIEDSMKVLRTHREILQAWIRSFPDMDAYPRIETLFHADGVPFHLVADGIDKDRKWVWHGFSFNPGLHRTQDYRLIGAHQSFDPRAEKLAVVVEQELGAFYRGLGFHAAILAGHGGTGYVRHIGEGRHVVEPIQHLFAPMTFRQHLRELVPSFVRAVKWRLQGLTKAR